MALFTLKTLHADLRLLENGAELKRRLATSSNTRTLKEGFSEMSRLIGVEGSVFKDARAVAGLIGAQRFTMIGGEPSVTDHVARVFDHSRILLTGLVSGLKGGSASGTKMDAGQQQGGAMAGHASGWSQLKSEATAPISSPQVEAEDSLDDLKTLLSGNTALTSRLFRVFFEHMLGFSIQSTASQGSVSLVNDLMGSKDHSRSFLSTALFVLGTELDPEHLMGFMREQGLFGIPVFEHLLQNRDYCGAFYSFRFLERAFIGSPVAEEAQLRERLDLLNAQLGGAPYGSRIFQAEDHDKVKIDVYLAAADVLEAMALTPWRVSLSNAVSLKSSHSIRSLSAVAEQFECYARRQATKDQANQAIADHLLAFARQFSADPKEPEAPLHG